MFACDCRKIVAYHCRNGVGFRGFVVFLDETFFTCADSAVFVGSLHGAVFRGFLPVLEWCFFT